MSEKEKVLQQISDIKNHLVDKEIFFPYNYNAFHVWSVITIILTIIIMPAYEKSIMSGTVVTFVLLGIGFIVEGTLTKKVNRSYDINDCTKKQQFVMKNFLLLSLFGILLSIVLASLQLYSVLFLVWLFLISIGQFAVGFVLNMKDLENISQFNIVMVLMLLGLGIYFNILQNEVLFLRVTQAMVILGLAVFPSLFALKLQKEERVKACGV